jgi:hypothetical protein
VSFLYKDNQPSILLTIHRLSREYRSNQLPQKKRDQPAKDEEDKVIIAKIGYCLFIFCPINVSYYIYPRKWAMRIECTEPYVSGNGAAVRRVGPLPEPPLLN